MTLYLLDTMILSRLVKEPEGNVARSIRALNENEACTSIVAAAELRFGAVRRGSRRLLGRVDRVLSEVKPLPLAPPAEETYATIRTQLERAGTPIGPNDLWIAAHALAIGATLVTDNVREFARVEGLHVENWLTR